jgi:NAD(P)-dependent dehydrogenase (short-subunit alcohol dehydrogenase family)
MGRRVAVTGGARGIGLATAGAFARRGATVVIGDVDADLAKTVAAELGGTGHPLDVRDRDSFRAFLDAAGPLDVLVNNAGVAPAGRFVDLDPDLLDVVVDVNLRGVVNGMRLALPDMLARGSGVVVNIASLAGRVPLPGAALYGGTKHAVLGLTAAVRGELHGSGVTVSAVLPTFVRTELVAGLNVAGLPKVDAVAVAAAVVRVATARRPPTAVTVPRWMTPLGTLYPMLPSRLRDALQAWAYPDDDRIDAGERADYERRLTGLLPEEA